MWRGVPAHPPIWVPSGDLSACPCLGFPSLSEGAKRLALWGSSSEVKGVSCGRGFTAEQAMRPEGGHPEQPDPSPTGASADPAGGEGAHGGHGAAGGAVRRRPGTLQRPERLPVQTGASGPLHLPGHPPPSGAPVGPDPRAYTRSSPSMRKGQLVSPKPPSHWLGSPHGHRSNLLLFKAAGTQRAGDPGQAQGRAMWGMLPSTLHGVSPALPAGPRPPLTDGETGLARKRGGCRALDSASPRFAHWLSHLLTMWPSEGSSESPWFPSDDHAPGCLGWGGPKGAGRAQHPPSTCTR